MEAVRVLIADDHNLVRRGTREILAQDPHIEVVGEAADGSEAVSLVGQTQPDVVLMDLGMPGMGGVEATRQIRENWPNVRVIILTVHGDDGYVLEAIQAGATGFLLKHVRDRELIGAVLTVAEGGAVIDPALVQVLIAVARNQFESPEPTEPFSLTERELAVLQSVAEGMSNNQIAERLGINRRTVETHLRNVFQKMGVQSRTQAAIQGILQGLFVTDNSRIR